MKKSEKKVVAALTGLGVALVAVDRAVSRLETTVSQVEREDGALFYPDTNIVAPPAAW